MQIQLDGRMRVHAPPKAMLDRLISHNTYETPEYAAAVKFKKSTDGLEQYIYDYEYDENNNVISIPRGLTQRFSLDKHDVEDNRVSNPVELNFSITLEGYQEPVLEASAITEEGVVVAPTGAGKTIIGLAIAYQKQEKTLILVHTTNLLEQWREEVQTHFGFDPGIIADGKGERTDAPVVIAMFQTGASDIAHIDVSQYGLALVDECHHVPAKTFAAVLDAIPSKFRYGLSATVDREDGMEAMLFSRIGKVLHEIPRIEVEKAGRIVKAHIRRIHTGLEPIQYQFDPKKKKKERIECKAWDKFIDFLVKNDSRNQFIANLAINSSKTHPTVILTDRTEHAEMLQFMTGGILLHGALPKEEKKKAMAEAKVSDIVVGTYGLLGEGINIPRWAHVILGTPFSSHGRLNQVIGRVIRAFVGKKMGYVSDLLEEGKMATNSYLKRQELYVEFDYDISAYSRNVAKVVKQPYIMKPPRGYFTKLKEKHKKKREKQKKAKEEKYGKKRPQNIVSDDKLSGLLGNARETKTKSSAMRNSVTL